MRLLHVDEDNTLICTNFAGRLIPPYAILSHRWGDDEVLYEHVINRTHQSKPGGYRKISFCAEQVAQDGLTYFWIDTCCIDKHNRRELSIAINSMFLWYQAAARCYVYLSDVSAPTEEDAKDRSRWETSFRQSVWHTRGWTLQELIAPSSVDFFSAERQRLGTRADLAQILAEITGIPLDVILGGPHVSFSIDDWIIWGKDRTTREPEDSVYCLLGILEVYLPLSYGEGEGKAMQRLREARQNPGMLSTIPFSRNDGFVGRESELAGLEAMLADGTQTRSIGIVGEGGTGKTQLTLELTYRRREKDKSLATFWVDASDLDSFQLGCTSIAQTLDIAGWGDEGADAGQLVKAQLEREGERTWLLVLDNVESALLGSRRLVDYLPRSTSGTVIFTTTDRQAAEMLVADVMVELRQMTEGAARGLMTAYLPELDSEAQRAETTQLLSELGYLPLAIAQAAAYIKNGTEVTAHTYRQRLVAQQRQLGRGQHGDGGQRGHDYQDPVAATLMVSLELLKGERPASVDCLAIAACVDRKDIPLDLLGPFSTMRNDAVDSLRDFGLITRRPGDDSFDIHRLVHLALRRWLREANALDRWMQETTARLVRLFPDSAAGNRGKWRRLLPHTRYVLESDHESTHHEESSGTQIRKRDIFRQLSRQLTAYKLRIRDRGSVREGQVQTTDPARRSYPGQHGSGGEEETRAELIHKCADALYQDGRWKEAEGLVVRALETRKKVLGDDHPDTLTSMANLAATYRDQGRWTEAERMELGVLESRKKVLGDNHLLTLSSLNNLALIYGKQGQWKEAEEQQVRVVEICKKVLGDDHPSTLTSMANLAAMYWNQSRWKEAEELQVEQVKRSKKVLGDDHPETLSSLNNLASTYRSQSRWDEAGEIQVGVIETRKKVLGENHPSTLSSIANLATIYSQQGRWQEAEGLQVEIIEIRKKILGESHPDTLISLSNLATIYGNQGRWDEAEGLQIQVVEMRKKVLGENHPITIRSIAHLAIIYKQQGRWQEAEELEVG